MGVSFGVLRAFIPDSERYLHMHIIYVSEFYSNKLLIRPVFKTSWPKVLNGPEYGRSFDILVGGPKTWIATTGESILPNAPDI